MCKRDCFNCKYDDCVVNDISSLERREIRERDERIAMGDDRAFAKTKSNRSKRKHDKH